MASSVASARTNPPAVIAIPRAAWRVSLAALGVQLGAWWDAWMWAVLPAGVERRLARVSTDAERLVRMQRVVPWIRSEAAAIGIAALETLTPAIVAILIPRAPWAWSACLDHPGCDLACVAALDVAGAAGVSPSGDWTHEEYTAMCVGIGQRGWSLKLASPERFNARMAAACFSHEAWDWDPLAHDPCLSVADLDRLLDVGHHPSEVGSLVAVLRHPAMRRRPRRSLLRRLHWTLCDQVLREAPELAALPGVASVVAEVPLCLTTVAWRGVLRHAPDRQRATLWRAYAAADPDAVVAMLRVITIEEPALLPRAATVALLSASDPNVRLATMQVLDHLVAADAQVSARRSAGGGVHEDTVRA